MLIGQKATLAGEFIPKLLAGRSGNDSTGN
jgi:hypothetical protein